MLRNIKQFFDQHIRPAGTSPAAGAQHALQVATAALLIEVMRSDRELKEAERHAVTAAIQARFELTTVYTAAVSANAAEPALAVRFIAILAGADTRALREAGGFES